MAAFSLSDFLKEIRRRRVFGVTVLYVVGAWVLLQVADLAFPGLEIPESSIRYVLIGTVLGLPVALIFGWRFDLTAQGIRRTPSVLETTDGSSLRTADYAVLIVLSTVSIAIVFLLTQKIVATQGVSDRVTTVAELPAFDPPEYSIAVLPFNNLSSDPEQEYFVAGMHDALISELARISGLMVISKTSTLHYQDSKLTIPAIARELNVAMLVEGSVFKSGDQVRIQIQLIGSQPERHLLSQSYDRELSSVLELQREVTRDITEKIKLNLNVQTRSRLADNRPVNPEAYENYLKGQFFANQFTADSLNKAVSYFEKAIALDPQDPLGYAGLAQTYAWIGAGHGNIPGHIAFPLARKAADRALQLDATLAEAHYVFGVVSMLDWDWLVAEREFRRAIELNQNFADAHLFLSMYLTAMQRHEEAIREILLAAQLNPLSPIIMADVAVNLFAARQFDRGIESAKKSLELNPEFAPAQWILGHLYLKVGMHEQAIEAHQKAAAANPIFTLDLAFTYAAIGEIQTARTMLIDANPEADPFVALKMAVVLEELGEYDQVFTNLEIAYQKRGPWLYWIRLYPSFDDLRSDPRYIDLVQRMDFPE